MSAAGLALIAGSLAPGRAPRPLASDRNVEFWLQADAQGATPTRLELDDVRFRAFAPFPRIVLHNQQLEGSRKTRVVVPVSIANLNRDFAAPVESAAIERSEWTSPTTFHARVVVEPNESAIIDFRDSRPDDPARFFVTGDPELNFDLLERFLAETRRERPAFVWILGDLFQEKDWIGETYLTTFEEAEVPVYVTIGNHDLIDDRRHGPFEARKEHFRRLFGPTDYAFDFRGAQFIALDTAAPYVSPTQFDWLERTLAGGEPRPRIVLTHKPFDDPRPGESHTIENSWDGERLGEMLRVVPDLVYYCGHVEGYYVYDAKGIPIRVVGSLTRQDRLEEDEGGENGYLDVSLGPEGPIEKRVGMENSGQVLEAWRMGTTCLVAYARHHPAGPLGAALLVVAAATATLSLRRARRRAAVAVGFSSASPRALRVP